MEKKDSVTRFRRLFRGRKTAHGEYIIAPDTESGKRVKTLAEGPTPEHWVSHLAGKDPMGPFLGIVPLTESNHCYFGAIDYDTEIDTFEMDKRVQMLGFPLVTVRSKSGGVHLYVFFSEPVQSQLVIDKLKAWARALGIERNPPEPPNFPKGRPTEVFPKQSSLKPTEQGSWINLPYYGGDSTNRYAVHNGEKLTLEEFLDYAESKQLSENRLAAQRDSHPNDILKDGPPCLQTLHAQGVGEGMRNQTLFNFAVFFKISDPEDWQSALYDYNENNVDPPLADDELDLIIRSVENNNYVYKCSDAPLESECQKTKCGKQKWGIKAFGDKKAIESLPEMSTLTKIKTDPPLWLLTIGGKQVEMTTDELISPVKFRKVCLEKLSIVIPTLKQSTWDDALRDLLLTHTEVEAPEDAGMYGEFVNVLMDFLEKRLAARNKEDILLGKPWEDEGRAYFRSADLMNHLRRKNFRDYSVNRVYTAMRDMGADHQQMKIRGSVIQVWSIPVSDDNLPDDLPIASRNRKEPTF